MPRMTMQDAVTVLESEFQDFTIVVEHKYNSIVKNKWFYNVGIYVVKGGEFNTIYSSFSQHTLEDAINDIRTQRERTVMQHYGYDDAPACLSLNPDDLPELKEEAA